MSVFATARMYLRRTPKLDEPSDLYTHTVRLLDGGELDLSSWHGGPSLIVNTASKCGFVPQFAGLQGLYGRYHGRGLNVLGCPSADFAGQEYDDASEIRAFCQQNYDVSFPVTEPMSVRADPAPLWLDLARQPRSGPPQWNFTKYLIGSDGRFIARWTARVPPEDDRLIEAIESAL